MADWLYVQQRDTNVSAPRLYEEDRPRRDLLRALFKGEHVVEVMATYPRTHPCHLRAWEVMESFAMKWETLRRGLEELP